MLQIRGTDLCYKLVQQICSAGLLPQACDADLKYRLIIYTRARTHTFVHTQDTHVHAYMYERKSEHMHRGSPTSRIFCGSEDPQL
jgi:hypothetical protein